MNWVKEKEHIYRAVRTFFQAFMGVVVAMIPTVDWTKPKTMLKATLFSIFVSSIAAGIAAVMNIKETKV